MMKKIPLNINILLGECHKGNRESQMQLHRRFYSFGLNLCLRYARNKEEAREMLNDGFLKVFTHLEKRKFEGAFTPWFKRVLINAAIDYHRKYKKYEFFDDIDELHSAIEDSDFSFNFEYEEILDAIQNLSPQYRMVFNLYVMEGYKHREIAEMLGITVGTSKSNLAKAKSNLQNVLKREFRQTK